MESRKTAYAPRWDIHMRDFQGSSRTNEPSQRKLYSVRTIETSSDLDTTHCSFHNTK